MKINWLNGDGMRVDSAWVGWKLITHCPLIQSTRWLIEGPAKGRKAAPFHQQNINFHSHSNLMFCLIPFHKLNESIL